MFLSQLSIIKDQILNQLSQSSIELFQDSPFWRVVEVKYSAKEFANFTDFSGLAWLKTQIPNLSPQFYLSLRDENRCFTAIGAVEEFTDLSVAEQFTQRHNLPLFGGRKFNGESYFFLPRLLWIEEKLEGKKLWQFRFFYRQNENLHNLQKEIEALSWDLAEFDPLPNLGELGEPLISEAKWCAEVAQGIQAIKHGKFSKVVLANAIKFNSIEPLDPYGVLKQSQMMNRGCYHFLWRQGKGNFSQNSEAITFVGSSPERLFQRQSNSLASEALAGTVKVMGNNTQDQALGIWLLQDQKNLVENQLVVNNISSALQDGCENFMVGEIRLKKLRNVQHLQRLINGKLKANYLDEFCLSRLHPTAAVAGFPKKPALDFLSQTENFTRDWYAGTLGIMSKNFSEFVVAIRSALIQNNQIKIFAGAGIVEGSDPQAEWQEIGQKAQSLITLFKSTT